MKKEKWTATASSLNSLPLEARAYIHILQLKLDPENLIRENLELTELVAKMTRDNEHLRAQLNACKGNVESHL